MPEIQARACIPSTLQDPYADDTTQPFWDAALEGRLVASALHQLRHVPAPAARRSASCASTTTFEWVELPGTGTIYSVHGRAPPVGPDARATSCPTCRA